MLRAVAVYGIFTVFKQNMRMFLTMKKMKIGVRMAISTMCVVAAALSASVASADATASSVVSICLNPERSLAWKSAAGSFSVDVTWPKSATSATVSVDDGVRRAPQQYEIADAAQGSLAIGVASPATEDDERILSLTLAFKDAHGAVVETRTARIGLVRGVDGNSFRVLGTNVPDRVWRNAGHHSVLPYPDDATGLTVDGVAVAGLTAPDWYFAKAVPNASDHAFALSTETGSVTEVLTLNVPGFSLVIR